MVTLGSPIGSSLSFDLLVVLVCEFLWACAWLFGLWFTVFMGGCWDCGFAMGCGLWVVVGVVALPWL